MTPTDPANPAIALSKYSAQDIPIETAIHSDFWHDAQPIYIEADNYARPMPHLRTEVRSRWTRLNLYFLFRCQYQMLYLKLAPDTREKTNQLWHWDVAEVFLGADIGDIRRYKEFEISPQGEWIDLDIDLNRKDHTDGGTWRSEFHVAAEIDRKNKIWYGAMQIPFAALAPRLPQQEAFLRVNFFRCEGPPSSRALLAWQAPMSDTFHVPEKFGLLKLIG